VSVEAQRVSHVLLRRGDLHFSSTVSRAASKQQGPSTTCASTLQSYALISMSVSSYSHAVSTSAL
jgi:hypothetical protein